MPLLPNDKGNVAEAPHRQLSAPLTLSANVFTSLSRRQLAVNDLKMSAILSTSLQRLGSRQRLYSPAKVCSIIFRHREPRGDV
jgi:hypothetical protein|tara:strand:- start:78 stop:326 length:249 start_codon:yes stop_codon:yes gene_type:complete